MGGPKKCHPFSAKKPVRYYSSKRGGAKKVLPPLRGGSEDFGPIERGAGKFFAHSRKNPPTPQLPQFHKVRIIRMV